MDAGVQIDLERAGIVEQFAEPGDRLVVPVLDQFAGKSERLLLPGRAAIGLGIRHGAAGELRQSIGSPGTFSLGLKSPSASAMFANPQARPVSIQAGAGVT